MAEKYRHGEYGYDESYAYQNGGNLSADNGRPGGYDGTQYLGCCIRWF